MSTAKTANFIAGIRLEDLPPPVVSKAKVCVRDVFGTMLGGLGTKSAVIARQIALEEMGGREEATLFGAEAKVSCVAAAFANAIAASDLDYDDGHATAGGHPAAPIVPATLAVAEFINAPGKTFLEGVIAGYESMLRANMMFRASPKHPVPSGGRTPHASGASGTFGAAAACAKVLGLDENGIFNALSIAGAHAPMSDSSKLPITGAMTKEAIGWGSLTGVAAAFLARRGFTGSTTIYDEAETDRSPLETLGETYEILNTYFKPYAACRYTHSAIDALLELKRKHSLRAEDIARIVVETWRGAAPLNSTRPKSIEQAQYSYPFCMAAAFLEGAVGPAQMAAPRLEDPEILQLADRVVVVHVPALDSRYRGFYPNVITVETKDGNRHQLRKGIPKGEPMNPLTERQLKAKLERLFQQGGLDRNRTRRINETLEHLEELPKIGHLIELMKT
ncbi:MAG: MmgE/PrpD family protein [Chloroflexi bacterium]|nr:MmgE/PrpD family protein [Chloroflexota bacterium]